MTRRKRLRKYLAFIVGALFLSLIISNVHHLTRPARPGEQNRGTLPLREPLTSVVEQYAPFVYAATDKRGGRQDIISNVDFDGDLVGNNNWENFDRFELTPTVYYA